VEGEEPYLFWEAIVVCFDLIWNQNKPGDSILDTQDSKYSPSGGSSKNL
jgi:hypothetical protein